MTESTRRRVGRPTVGVLSRELILRTALRLLDELGEGGVGMRDIARELGVRPSALYNHIGGHDELIDGVRELVSDRIDVSGFGLLPWEDAVRRWATSYRRAFAAHPPTIALLAVRPLRAGSRTARMYDAVCGGLMDAGWPEHRVLTVVVALESFILGSAFDQVAPADMLDPDGGARAGLDRETEAVEAIEAVPRFRAAYASRARALLVTPADAAFAAGLDAFLAGLRAEHAALRAAGPGLRAVGSAALSGR